MRRRFIGVATRLDSGVLRAEFFAVHVVLGMVHGAMHERFARRVVFRRNIAERNCGGRCSERRGHEKNPGRRRDGPVMHGCKESEQSDCRVECGSGDGA
jgi:hypothetical protein